jgi:esterase/lipase
MLVCDNGGFTVVSPSNHGHRFMRLRICKSSAKNWKSQIGTGYVTKMEENKIRGEKIVVVMTDLNCTNFLSYFIKH